MNRKPIAGQTRRLLGQYEAKTRRDARSVYCHWQERDLRMRLEIYQGIVDNWAEDKLPIGMGRKFYLIRARMIANELRRRRNEP